MLDAARWLHAAAAMLKAAATPAPAWILSSSTTVATVFIYDMDLRAKPALRALQVPTRYLKQLSCLNSDPMCT